MALTRNGIQEAKQIINTIMNEETNLTDTDEILNFMNGDANFQKFINETKFGQETSEKWTNLIKLIKGDLKSCLTNMDKATNDFLNRQETYNSSSNILTGSIETKLRDIDKIQNISSGNSSISEGIHSPITGSRINRQELTPTPYTGETPKMINTPGSIKNPEPIYTTQPVNPIRTTYPSSTGNRFINLNTNSTEATKW